MGHEQEGDRVSRASFTGIACRHAGGDQMDAERGETAIRLRAFLPSTEPGTKAVRRAEAGEFRVDKTGEALIGLVDWLTPVLIRAVATERR